MLRVCRHSHKMGSHNKTLFAHRTFLKTFADLFAIQFLRILNTLQKWKYEEEIVAHHCRLAYYKLHNYHFTLPLETRNCYKCSNVWVKVLLLNRPMLVTRRASTTSFQLLLALLAVRAVTICKSTIRCHSNKFDICIAILKPLK